VHGEDGCAIGAPVNQEPEQPFDMWHVANEHDVACFTRQGISHPLWRVGRLQPSSRRDGGERVTAAPVCVNGLSCPKLPAMLDDCRLDLSPAAT
jgi:hypothetical protein